VDAHVGSHIFKQCIQHALATKTRLLVTHQLHLLKHADWIICMDRGEVVEQGTFAELMQMDRILATMLKDSKHPAGIHTAGPGQDGGEEEMGRDKESDVPQGEASMHGGLMSEEERVVGGVASSVYRSYLRAAGGLMMALVIVMLLVSKEMSRVGYVGCTGVFSFTSTTSDCWDGCVGLICGLQHGSRTHSTAASASTLGSSWGLVFCGWRYL
jgi:ATP-binding cassette subfamily C (CFTR/MRP) protein 1